MIPFQAFRRDCLLSLAGMISILNFVPFSGHSPLVFKQIRTVLLALYFDPLARLGI